MIWSGSVAYHDSLADLMVPIESVQRHPENYNEGDVELIDESFEINGMYDALKVQRSTGYIVVGNHTYETCLLRGAKDVPVIWLDIDDETALRIMVADNEIARAARPNRERLLNVMQKMPHTMGTGMAPRDIEVLQALQNSPLRFEREAWPTLSFRVPPEVKRAFFDLTEGAQGERERFEVLLRMAGWEG